MAACETWLLQKLHRAVKLHYKAGQHGDCYLGQDIFNSILMVLSCHPAHQEILHTAEDSGTGQTKICSCSYSKWALTAHHMPDAVPGEDTWWQLRHHCCSPGVYPPAKEMSVWEGSCGSRMEGRCKRWGSEEPPQWELCGLFEKKWTLPSFGESLVLSIMCTFVLNSNIINFIIGYSISS